MKLKFIMPAAVVACLGLTVSLETAYAGNKHDQMTGRVRYSVGCEKQERVLKAMNKNPERWGRPPASLSAQYQHLSLKAR
jgi:hypothetical protein